MSETITESATANAKSTAEAATSIVDAIFDLGIGWAAFGLKAGKAALQQGAKTLEQTAKTLEGIARELEKDLAPPKA